MKYALPYMKILALLTYNLTLYGVSYVKLKFFKNDSDNENIDIVFLWVDGDDPVLMQKRNKYFPVSKNTISNSSIDRNGLKACRWKNNNEILVALKGIQNFCPWVHKIWIITDNQSPKLDVLSVELRKKITIVDHRKIFSGYEEFLPTFNSLSIESLLWRIKGLSEKFIYLNDDFILLKPVVKTDFFIGNKPVFRGIFRVFKNTEISLHHTVQLNGALATGRYGKPFFFKQSHAPYVLKKSLMEKLFNLHKENFKKNIQFRFRSKEPSVVCGG